MKSDIVPVFGAIPNRQLEKVRLGIVADIASEDQLAASYFV
jgi:hypothetical protein